MEGGERGGFNRGRGGGHRGFGGNQGGRGGFGQSRGNGSAFGSQRGGFGGNRGRGGFGARGSFRGRGGGDNGGANNRQELQLNPTKLHVTNLTKDCTSKELEELFQTCGKVEECDIVKDFAFVHFRHEEEAKKAVQTLNMKDFKGKPLQVKHSISKVRQKPGSANDCFNCGGRGHSLKECPTGRNSDSRKGLPSGRPSPYGDPYSGRERQDPYNERDSAAFNTYLDPYLNPYAKSRAALDPYGIRDRTPRESNILRDVMDPDSALSRALDSLTAHGRSSVDPFSAVDRASKDPFAGIDSVMDPYPARERLAAADPYAARERLAAADPYAARDRLAASDPYAARERLATANPFAAIDRLATDDPYAAREKLASLDPYAAMERLTAADPHSDSDPYDRLSRSADPYAARSSTSTFDPLLDGLTAREIAILRTETPAARDPYARPPPEFYQRGLALADRAHPDNLSSSMLIGTEAIGTARSEFLSAPRAVDFGGASNYSERESMNDRYYDEYTAGLQPSM